MLQLQNEIIQFPKSEINYYLESYFNELEAQSKDTRVAYEGDFSRFTETVFGNPYQFTTTEQLETVNYDTIIQYRNSMNLANSTINRHVNSIKSILTYLKGRNVIQIDLEFFSIIKELKTQVNEIPHMPISVVHEYIEEAKNERFNANTKVNLLIFAVDSGLRLSEIVNLKLSNFKVYDNYVLLSGYGKGNKKYKDKISTDIYNEVMQTYQENDEQRVFYPLTEKNIKDMMVRIRKKLNYENEKYSFHSLRKTSITYTHDLTGSLLIAQRKANHSSPNTTTIYIEDRELPMTGYFSTQTSDENKYKNVSHEELLNALASMPEEFLQILNNKLPN